MRGDQHSKFMMGNVLMYLETVRSKLDLKTQAELKQPTQFWLQTYSPTERPGPCVYLILCQLETVDSRESNTHSAFEPFPAHIYAANMRK